MPDPADLAERLRQLALSLPEAYEDEPWGHPVFKCSDNRMFASMNVGETSVSLTVKLTPEEREIAELLPYVHRARYVGRYGWVTAEVDDEESLEAALEWMRESYWLKAPTSLRGVVEQWDESERESSCRSRSSIVRSAKGRGLPKPNASRAGSKRRSG